MDIKHVSLTQSSSYSKNLKILFTKINLRNCTKICKNVRKTYTNIYDNSDRSIH